MAKTTKRLYKIETYDYGTFYRYATNVAAAKSRIVYEIFGRGYEGWAHDYWTVTEVVRVAAKHPQGAGVEESKKGLSAA